MNTRIAIVTGGNRGLGKDMVQRLAARGVAVIFTYRANKAEAQSVVSELQAGGARIAALQLSVGDTSSYGEFAEDVARTLAGWRSDRFNFLVNNAGIGTHVPFAETTEAQFDELMNVHFRGVYFLTQKLLPLIADGGRIINISSGLARFAMPGMSAYACMKGAVEVLTRYLAKELGPRGIAVNTIAPGAIATDFGGGRVRDNQETSAQIASITALGRVGRPEDIGGVIASLLEPENAWINGQRIEVSGGMLL
jgi:NAD(P)-dependent dehydrogenase (short-subunit alcohol dehydrogenase family)